MGAQHQGFRFFRPKLGHHLVPQQPGGAQFGNLHEKVHADGEKERQPGGETVHIHAACDGGADIFAAVGDGKGQFLHQIGPGLLHVIATDADRIEFWHFTGSIFNNVGHDPHRWFGGVDIGVADHEFLEDIVLDGARQGGAWHALLLSRDNETGQHRDDRAIHRHRHRNFVERNAVEQNLHILDAVDCDPGFAHIALDSWVVTVITAVGGKIESDGHTLLAAR